MDRKTLEYMEQRAQKARAIVKKIEELSSNADCVQVIDGVAFYDQNGGSPLFRLNKHNQPDLVKTLRSAMQGLIADEITRLEAELAEL